MPTLFDITDDMRALDQLLEDCGGDISDPAVEEAITKWMAEIKDGFETKVDNYCAFIKELTARAAARREEMERLAMRVKADENAAKSLKVRLQMVWEAMQLGKVATRRFSVSLAGNGGLAPLTVDPAQVPQEFFVQPPPVIDNDKIRLALEAGRDVPGAALLPRGKHINIR